MVARLLLPLSSPDLLHSPDRPIPGSRSSSSARYGRGPSRWHHDLRTSFMGGFVDRDRVVGSVGCDACDVVLHSLDHGESGLRLVGIPIGEDLANDRTRSIDTEVELFSAAFALPAMLRGRPFSFANDREPGAVNDEMDGLVGGDVMELDLEALAASRERRVVGCGEVDAHHPEERVQEALCLAERQAEDETESQSGLDGDLGVLPLPASLARSGRFPVGNGPGDSQMVMSPRSTSARS